MKKNNLTKVCLFTTLFVVFVASLMVINSKLTMNRFMKNQELSMEIMRSEISMMAADNLAFQKEIIDLKAEKTELLVELNDLSMTDEAVTLENPNSEIVTITAEEKITPEVIPEETPAPEETFIVATTEINTTDIAAKSNLTADQFNTVLSTILTKQGNQDTSMLMLTGEALVAMEEESNINGLYALSVASLESGYGTSSLARNKNNLFGLAGSNGYMKLDSIDECIQYFGRLTRKNYIDQGYTDLYSIGGKYCPANQSAWASDVGWFMTFYADKVTNILLNTQ